MESNVGEVFDLSVNYHDPHSRTHRSKDGQGADQKTQGNADRLHSLNVKKVAYLGGRVATTFRTEPPGAFLTCKLRIKEGPTLYQQHSSRTIFLSCLKILQPEF